MENRNILIKFHKSAIQSRTNKTLTLRPFLTQDNFFNQFTFRSIVTDEMLFPQKKINIVNFENLVGICHVIGLDKLSLEEKENLAKKMADYNFVEYAYVQAPFESPVLPIHPKTNEEKSLHKKTDTIPDLTYLQGYKHGIEYDHIGIDMDYAWSRGITGQGICCSVVEIAFNYKHVNLKRESYVVFFGEDNTYEDHGTATSGIMYANNVGFGVKGLVHGADKFYAVNYLNNPDYPIEDPNWDAWECLYNSILKLLQNLKSGDVVSISIGGAYGPLDVNQGAWDIFKAGLDAGIIICLAATNDNINLDHDENPLLRNWRARPDIGIIRAGAGDKLLRKQNFSTYGSQVHLQAWGNDVVTTGYGDLYNDGVNDYTKIFNGTSAASPIVASAAVAVQSWYKQQTGSVLSPFEMRTLLTGTGIPQRDPENGHIGPIPNVRNAIKELERRLYLNL